MMVVFRKSIGLVIVGTHLFIGPGAFAIIGGFRGALKQFPASVAFGVKTNKGIGTFCSGSKIDDFIYLTARHCRIGDYRTVHIAHAEEVDSDSFDAFTVEKVNPHPSIDIALVKIGESSPRVSQAYVSSSALASNTLIVAAGFGIYRAELFRKAVDKKHDKINDVSIESPVRTYLKGVMMNVVIPDAKSPFVYFNDRKGGGDPAKAAFGDSGGGVFLARNVPREGPFTELVGVISLVTTASNEYYTAQQSFFVRLDRVSDWLRDSLNQLRGSR
ncbi:MAG: S1 family peptidase [Deltaproteobacteria bacterium]|nr:S1 family peptidase [Deltaproteobacteria bacterium]